MFIQTVHNSLFGALEKDRNGVPVVKKEPERRSGAFRLETNTGRRPAWNWHNCTDHHESAHQTD